MDRIAHPELLRRLAALKPSNQEFVLKRLGLVRPPASASESPGMTFSGSKCLGPDCKPTDGEIVEAVERGKWTVFGPRSRSRNSVVDDSRLNWSLVHPDRDRFEAPTFREAVALAIKAERERSRRT